MVTITIYKMCIRDSHGPAMDMYYAKMAKDYQKRHTIGENEKCGIGLATWIDMQRKACQTHEKGMTGEHWQYIGVRDISHGMSAINKNTHNRESFTW